MFEQFKASIRFDSLVDIFRSLADDILSKIGKRVVFEFANVYQEQSKWRLVIKLKQVNQQTKMNKKAE